MLKLEKNCIAPIRITVDPRDPRSPTPRLPRIFANLHGPTGLAEGQAPTYYVTTYS